MTTNETPQNAVMEPCPFCLKTDALIITGTGYPNEKRVVCNYNNGGCGASKGAGDTEAEAIKKWNTRALTAAEVSRSQERTSVTEIDVESLKRAFQAGFEISAEGCNGEYNDGEDMSGYLERGFNVFLKASGLLSKYPERFK